MTIEERAEKAAQLKMHGGYNCCQSVVESFSDKIAVDPQTMKNIASGFAVGMGCMEATCGALMGATMIAGILADGKPAVPVAKQVLQDFKNRCGATICKELKGIETGTVLCPCEDCVRNAVRSLCTIVGINE